MTHPEPFIRSIPLNRLELAPENVRKTPADPAALAELKASIAAHGLLENLIVRIEDTGHDPGSGPEQAHVDRCAVVAGGRRLAAMKALAEEGILNADHPVPCRVIDAAENAGELSLAENVVRVAMHPADQVVAFLKLSEAGVTVAAIAARFGVAERLVEQRLSLGGVAPELLDAYRAQEMDLDTLKAFTVTIDHARQKAVWEQVKEQGYGPSGVAGEAHADRGRACPPPRPWPVSSAPEAYEAAGGTLTRDLFAGEDGSGTWFDDPVLLNELATEKLPVRRLRDLTTRWKWAEAALEADWSAVAGFGRISPEPGVPTEEEKAERESLRARHDELVNMDEDEWARRAHRGSRSHRVSPRCDRGGRGVKSRVPLPRFRDSGLHRDGRPRRQAQGNRGSRPARRHAGTDGRRRRGRWNRCRPRGRTGDQQSRSRRPPTRAQEPARRRGSGSDSQTTCAPSARPWSRRICPGTSRPPSTSPCSNSHAPPSRKAITPILSISP